MSYQLQILHGYSDHHSEVVKLKMSSIDGKESLNMNTVLIVDEILVEHFSINVISKFAHVKDPKFSTSNRVLLRFQCEGSCISLLVINVLICTKCVCLFIL